MIILIQKVISYIVKYKIHISINLDFTDIVNPKLKDFLLNNINKNNIGSYLTIEILEGEKITNFELVNNFINDVRKYNVKIAIDDFGSGFSNYEYILSLNADYLKIDGSLIKKINEDVYFNLIKSIVLFCKQENIKIIAEFVSDIKILRYVKSIDIDYSQGYYINKPTYIDEIIKEINEETTKENN
jgi:EAL domain-containing protein (putative c-di-GMP-specific phosphodiesterase class I)